MKTNFVMIKKIATLLLIASTYINAQERCGTEAITKHRMEIYPEYRIAREKVNVQTEQWIAKVNNLIK